MKVLQLLIFVSIAFTQRELDTYISIAIKNNLTLKQKSYSYKQGSLELKKAKFLFLPSVDINTRYTESAGGRSINLILGYLMNT